MEYTNNFTIDSYVHAQNRINELYANHSTNNAWSAMQAQKQNEFQIAQNAKAMNFNMIEAEKNRNWQEYMSNTAHQRETRDLMAAGLNPVLSAMNGNGAAVTSGATAQGVTSAGAKGDTDESINGAIASVLGSVLNADYSLRNAEVNAKAMESVAQTYAEMDHIIAQLNAATSKENTRYTADKHYYASKYAADASAAASMYSSNVMSAATRYAADQNKMGQIYSAGRHYAASKYQTDYGTVSGSAFTLGDMFTGVVADLLGIPFGDSKKSNNWSHGHSSR